MKIIEVLINNYRNLDGKGITLDDDCNFIVGENNLGKSNFLSMLNILFTSRAFRFEDFKDFTKPIKINLKIKLSAIEVGHFQDLFDANDYNLINIVAKQINSDDNINFYHLESDTFISALSVRCINYVHYDSLRNPISEINFDKGRGVGKFLRYIISQYLEEEELIDSEFLDQTKVQQLLHAVNNKISKVKSFKDFEITACADNDVENLLSKIVVLNDCKGDHLSKTGYGVQFLILVTLSILEKLQIIKQQRGDRGIFEDEQTNSKSISLIIGLDEPEIHLHPYMQRSLIKYLNSIINNQNNDFKALVKELFDIDYFIGQVIVVTHSPHIILNSYKQIIRFYAENSITKVISGATVALPEQLEKHLYIHFPFIKEAFFSRCCIFVEGDSEYASFPKFAEKLSVDFDDLGICILQARGESIAQLIALASHFGIPSVGINDKDDGSHAPTLTNHFETNLVDFEDEITALIEAGKESKLRIILCALDSLGENREFNAAALNKRALKKYKISSIHYSNGIKLSDVPITDTATLKAYYLTWFSVNKSYALGRLIGDHLSADEIPNIYQQVITEASKLV